MIRLRTELLKTSLSLLEFKLAGKEVVIDAQIKTVWLRLPGKETLGGIMAHCMPSEMGVHIVNFDALKKKVHSCETDVVTLDKALLKKKVAMKAVPLTESQVYRGGYTLDMLDMDEDHREIAEHFIANTKDPMLWFNEETKLGVVVCQKSVMQFFFEGDLKPGCQRIDEPPEDYDDIEE